MPDTLSISVAEDIKTKDVGPGGDNQKEYKKDMPKPDIDRGGRIKNTLSQMFEVLQLRARPGNAFSTCLFLFDHPFRMVFCI